MDVLPLVRPIAAEDAEPLLAEWRWLVERHMTPLYLTALGDWLFGAPDGSLWILDMLEGDLRRVARTAAEYNRLKESPEWLDEQFLAGWYDVAVGNGLMVGSDECLGWAVHPLLGGAFDRTNLKVFSVRVYQSLMGQLHRRRS